MQSDRRRIVIVGAATGIGAAGARALTRAGWRVALVDIAEDAMRAVAAEIDAPFAFADASSPELAPDAGLPLVLLAATAAAALALGLNELAGTSLRWRAPEPNCLPRGGLSPVAPRLCWTACSPWQRITPRTYLTIFLA